MSSYGGADSASAELVPCAGCGIVLSTSGHQTAPTQCAQVQIVTPVKKTVMVPQTTWKERTIQVPRLIGGVTKMVPKKTQEPVVTQVPMHQMYQNFQMIRRRSPDGLPMCCNCVEGHRRPGDTEKIPKCWHCLRRKGSDMQYTLADLEVMLFEFYRKVSVEKSKAEVETVANYHINQQELLNRKLRDNYGKDLMSVYGPAFVEFANTIEDNSTQQLAVQASREQERTEGREERAAHERRVEERAALLAEREAQARRDAREEIARMEEERARFEGEREASIERERRVREERVALLAEREAQARREEDRRRREERARETTLLEVMALARTCRGEKFSKSRLFLVGEGRAGKTCFARALQGETFRPTESTVGVETEDLEVASTELSAGGDWKRHVARHGEREQAQARFVNRRRERGSEAERGFASAMDCVAGLTARMGEVDVPVHHGALASPAAPPEGILMSSPAFSETLAAAPAASNIQVRGTCHDCGQPVRTDQERFKDQAGAYVHMSCYQQRQTGPVSLGDTEGWNRAHAGEVQHAPPQAAALHQPEPLTPVKLDMEIVREYAGQLAPPLVFSVWDFGGQEAFQYVHHLLLTRSGVYLIFFNMLWLENGAPEALSRQSLSRIKFWLTSTFVHASSARDREGRESLPPVLLIGTHKDKCSSPAQHEYISKRIYQAFGSTLPWTQMVKPFKKGTVPSGRGLLQFFPVDNTMGKHDPVVREVMAEVERLALHEEYVQQEVPLAWLGMLDAVRADKRTSITWLEWTEMGRRNGLPASPNHSLQQELLLLSSFLSSLGFIMHHPEPALADLVITNPVEFLVGPASKLVCDHHIHYLPQHEAARGRLPALWQRMVSKGVVNRRLLPVLWSEHREEVKEKLEELMVKFGVLVPLLSGAEAQGSDAGSGDVLYLVPALLPEGGLAGTASNVKLTCFVLFGIDEVARDWQARGHTSLPEVAQLGFLPVTVFWRLLGKLAQHMQLTTQCGVEDMELYKETAVFSSGKHQFMVTHLPEQCCLRVDLLVASPVVLEILLEHVKQVLREAIHSLQCCMAVPKDGGRGGDAYVGYAGEVVLLHGAKGLINRVAREEAMYVAPRESLGCAELRARFELVLPGGGDGGLAGYDVFLSYRWGDMDSEIMSGLFQLLSEQIIGERAIRVFLDSRRLQKGSNFQQDFALALANSTMAVPLVSSHALNKMFTLQPDSEDNVLLEWVMILELASSKRLKACLPILLGSPRDTPSANGSMCDSLFVGRGPASLPEEPCTRVAELASSYLRGLQSPSAELAGTTIRDAVGRMTKMNGVTSWQLDAGHGGGSGGRCGVQSAHGSAQHSTVHHLKEAFKRNLIRYAAKQILLCLERVQAEDPHAFASSRPHPVLSPSPHPPAAPPPSLPDHLSPLSSSSSPLPPSATGGGKLLAGLSTEEVSAVLQRCGAADIMGPAAEVVVKNGLTGVDIEEYLGIPKEERHLNPLYIPLVEGGLGLGEIQVRKLRREVNF